ncbi:uncharacterized protein BXZ73DRAFT_98693 [Epithele typhae]|uniref:uncharacterized protein n=1 Tax=Epithele typhae TaxID=378194 RepID=UPI0020088088|nr:uncharacterized protein BXZ73DRAFT_98693 [Epithele typhae]KAH9940860.1 hypothetical protein BXZ73DRAFT_98693 [Epithele typhae]
MATPNVSSVPSPPQPRALVRHYQAPEPVTDVPGCSIFLCGAIEHGSERWQERVHLALAARVTADVTLFDPYRQDWDETWRNSADDARFAAQTEWELAQLGRADVVAVHLPRAPGLDAPASLLELGLAVGAGKRVVVCCPDGFGRKGNVEVVCRRWEVTLVETVEALVEVLAGEVAKGR